MNSELFQADISDGDPSAQPAVLDTERTPDGKKRRKGDDEKMTDSPDLPDTPFGKDADDMITALNAATGNHPSSC